jgi:anthranilate phosphoribosyltransferase
LNTATALYTAGVAPSIADGLQQARAAISSGAARKKLTHFIEVTQQLGGH